MKPLGTESHNALSRGLTHRLRKAGRGKGRQEERELCRDGLEEAYRERASLPTDGFTPVTWSYDVGPDPDRLWEDAWIDPDDPTHVYVIGRRGDLVPMLLAPSDTVAPRDVRKETP